MTSFIYLLCFFFFFFFFVVSDFTMLGGVLHRELSLKFLNLVLRESGTVYLFSYCLLGFQIFTPFQLLSSFKPLINYPFSLISYAILIINLNLTYILWLNGIIWPSSTPMLLLQIKYIICLRSRWVVYDLYLGSKFVNHIYIVKRRTFYIYNYDVFIS